MAIFTNRALLTYNNGSTGSNIVTGEIRESLTATKNALTETYTPGSTVTYLVHLFNSGSNALTGLTVTDDLGAYPFGGGSIVPLSYVEGSLRYFVNGVLQPTPIVGGTAPLTVSGISVPAGGEALIAYEALVNDLAPLGDGAFITNTVNVTGASTATATETITAAAGTELAIIKALEPESVAAGGQITYIFTIENYGSTAAVATDNLSVTDTFLPILQNVSVSYNGSAWTEGVQYTYDEATGVFVTNPGQITVPAATFSQDPVTGEWNTVPGVAIVTVVGTV